MNCYVICIIYFDCDWSIFFFKKNKGGNGIVFGNRIWIEFFIYFVLDCGIYFCGKWKYVFDDCYVDF